MISAFPFEGFFKICHGLYYGTRSLAEQILKNINIMQYLGGFEKLSHFKIINLRLHEFRNKLRRNTHNNAVGIQDGLVDASTSTLNQMNLNEYNLISSLNLGIQRFTPIEKSLTCVQNAISMMKFFYALIICLKLNVV